MNNKLLLFVLQVKNLAILKMEPFTRRHLSFMTQIASYLPKLRKKARRTFFQIKFLFSRNDIPKTFPKNKLKILIHINGGVGDGVISRLMLKNLKNIFPQKQAIIFLCCKNKETFDTFFKKENLADFYVNRGYFLKSYDIVISGCSCMEYEHLKKGITKSLPKDIANIIKTGLKRQKEFAPFIDGDPYTDRFLAHTALELNLNRYTLPLYMLGFDIQNSDLKTIPLNYDLEEKETLEKFNLKSQKYITIHYDNGENPVKGFRPTRVWPKQNWKEFTELFKQTYPDISIVQLGGNINFHFADLCLNNKTTLTELSALLKNSLLHIDGESALVHIAACVGTKSIVLFGPTNKDYFAYPQNINIKAQNCCNCMWVTKSWRSACPLGYKEGQDCLSTINPKTIFALTSEYLNKKLL